MVLCENSVVFLFTLLQVDISVLGTSYQDGRGGLVKWIVRDLKVAECAIDLALAADIGLGNELLTLPIPEEDLPVRLTRQGDNHAAFFMAESTGDELLRVIRVTVLNLLGQRLLFLLSCQVED